MKDSKIMLSQRLKSLRSEHSLSQYQLADALGVSRGLIGNYELGTREPDYNTLVLFAEYFDVSIDYILGLTDVRARLSEFQLQIDTNIFTDYMNLSPESKNDVRRYIDLLKLRDKK